MPCYTNYQGWPMSIPITDYIITQHSPVQLYWPAHPVELTEKDRDESVSRLIKPNSESLGRLLPFNVLELNSTHFTKSLREDLSIPHQNASIFYPIHIPREYHKFPFSFCCCCSPPSQTMGSGLSLEISLYSYIVPVSGNTLTSRIIPDSRPHNSPPLIHKYHLHSVSLCSSTYNKVISAPGKRLIYAEFDPNPLSSIADLIFHFPISLRSLFLPSDSFAFTSPEQLQCLALAYLVVLSPKSAAATSW